MRRQLQRLNIISCEQLLLLSYIERDLSAIAKCLVLLASENSWCFRALVDVCRGHSYLLIGYMSILPRIFITLFLLLRCFCHRIFIRPVFRKKWVKTLWNISCRIAHCSLFEFRKRCAGWGYSKWLSYEKNFWQCAAHHCHCAMSNTGRHAQTLAMKGNKTRWELQSTL